jgi:hypothetical protein
MKFFFFGDVADLYISPQHQRCPTHSTSGQLIYGARKRARTRDSDTYGTNSSFPHTELLRRSLLAQESFSSVVTVQSCLCSRSSSIAEREPEPFVGTRPESHRSAFCSCIHSLFPRSPRRIPKGKERNGDVLRSSPSWMEGSTIVIAGVLDDIFSNLSLLFSILLFFLKSEAEKNFEVF